MAKTQKTLTIKFAGDATPRLTIPFYNTGTFPKYRMTSFPDWDAPLLPKRITEENPLGGIYIDNNPRLDAKIVTVQFAVQINSASQEWTVRNAVKAITQGSSMITLALTRLYTDTGDTYTETLSNCIITDVTATEREGNVLHYSFVFTAKGTDFD